MRKSLIGIVIVAAMLVVGAPRGRASNIKSQPISIDNTCPPVSCSVDPGFLGSPATGNAEFTPIGIPLTFSFGTGDASTSCGNFGPPEAPCPDGNEYEATFGSGGSFTMTGPAGLTFAGVVTSGFSAAAGLGMVQGDVGYSGKWSDGVDSSGTASIDIQGLGTGSVHIDGVVPVVPEPSTLLLFGSGLLLVGIIVYRKQLARDGLIDG